MNRWEEDNYEFNRNTSVTLLSAIIIVVISIIIYIVV